jgi:hypothetical protein
MACLDMQPHATANTTHLAVPPRRPDTAGRLGRPAPVRPVVLAPLQETVRIVESPAHGCILRRLEALVPGGQPHVAVSSDRSSGGGGKRQRLAARRAHTICRLRGKRSPPVPAPAAASSSRGACPRGWRTGSGCSGHWAGGTASAQLGVQLALGCSICTCSGSPAALHLRRACPESV